MRNQSSSSVRVSALDDPMIGLGSPLFLAKTGLQGSIRVGMPAYRIP
jgi:hypothetical protein